MTKTIEEANKVLVLRAFDTLFNKRDDKTAERFWSPNFKTVAGFEHTYMWSTNGSLESDPDKVEEELPKSALPFANGSLLHIVTFPLAKTATFLDVGCSAVSQTPAGTRRYVRAGRIANARHPDCGLRDPAGRRDRLELDDGETVHLVAGDLVVQQATRHGWRNKGEQPATIAFCDAWHQTGLVTRDSVSTRL